MVVLHHGLPPLPGITMAALRFARIGVDLKNLRISLVGIDRAGGTNWSSRWRRTRGTLLRRQTAGIGGFGGDLPKKSGNVVVIADVIGVHECRSIGAGPLARLLRRSTDLRWVRCKRI